MFMNQFKWFFKRVMYVIYQLIKLLCLKVGNFISMKFNVLCDVHYAITCSLQIRNDSYKMVFDSFAQMLLFLSVFKFAFNVSWIIKED